MEQVNFKKIINVIMALILINIAAIALFTLLGISEKGFSAALIEASNNQVDKGNLVLELSMVLIMLLSYVLLWMRKNIGVWLFFASSLSWWAYVLIIDYVEINSAPMLVLTESVDALLTIAAVLVWVYNKKD
jgi:hypothetical protein